MSPERHAKLLDATQEASEDHRRIIIIIGTVVTHKLAVEVSRIEALQRKSGFVNPTICLLIEPSVCACLPICLVHPASCNQYMPPGTTIQEVAGQELA